MQWISIIFIGLIGSILIVVVKQYKPEIAVVLSIIVGVLMLISAVSLVNPILTEIEEITDKSNVSLVNISVLLKAIGICYVTQFVSDICRDSGQSAISTKVELVGRLAMCVVSFPLYKELISLIEEIIGRI